MHNNVIKATCALQIKTKHLHCIYRLEIWSAVLWLGAQVNKKRAPLHQWELLRQLINEHITSQHAPVQLLCAALKCECMHCNSVSATQGVAEHACSLSPKRLKIKGHFSGCGRRHWKLTQPLTQSITWVWRSTLFTQFVVMKTELILYLTGIAHFKKIPGALCGPHPWVVKWLTHAGHCTLCGSKLA